MRYTIGRGKAHVPDPTLEGATRLHSLLSFRNTLCFTHNFVHTGSGPLPSLCMAKSRLDALTILLPAAFALMQEPPDFLVVRVYLEAIVQL